MHATPLTPVTKLSFPTASFNLARASSSLDFFAKSTFVDRPNHQQFLKSFKENLEEICLYSKKQQCSNHFIWIPNFCTKMLGSTLWRYHLPMIQSSDLVGSIIYILWSRWLAGRQKPPEFRFFLSYSVIPWKTSIHFFFEKAFLLKIWWLR